MTRSQAKNQPKRNPSIQNERENLYQCEHCMEFFKPKKRFVQKYCSESCRVMAYRDRNSIVAGHNGRNLSGIDQSLKHAQTNPSKHRLHTGFNHEILSDLKTLLDERDKEIIQKINTIHSNQKYHMWISGLAPFIAELIGYRLSQNSKETQHPLDKNQLLQILEPIIKNLPQDLGEELLKTTSDYREKQIAKKGNGGVAGFVKSMDFLILFQLWPVLSTNWPGFMA
jgi:hypothetical protein